jgi:hypothetical protein
MKATIFRSGLIAVLAAVAFAAAPAVMASAKSGGSHAKPRPSPSPTSSPSPAAAGPFSVGQMQASTVGATGCGTNSDGEPTIHVSPAGNLFLGSERGLGGGSDGWRQVPTTAGSGASACSLVYAGQPNAVAGVGASGGDIDSAWGSALNSAGTYTLYVSSLNLGSVSVAHSTDDGATFTNVPVQGGLPGDDREWIAAYGADTSLLTFHDITTNDIDVLRSDNGGGTYTEISQAIPLTDYKAGANELGNLVIDHRNSAGTVAGGGGPGFWAYQSFVAPSTSSGSSNNEAFVAVSNDGGYTWTDQPVPCSVSSNSLDHNFPNVSVAPDGTLWMSWSDDTNVFTASSGDHGSTWSCSSPASTNTVQAIFPWIVATSAGEDLVYYGTTTSGGKGSNQTWYVYFVQNTGSGWGVPQQVVSVHSGSVCEGGISCTGGRQLFDDFGVDTDQQGWAHIAYSHDSPDLGGSGTYTGYAVQTGGTQVGYPN